jgi:hypothetical protein
MSSFKRPRRACIGLIAAASLVMSACGGGTPAASPRSLRVRALAAAEAPTSAAIEDTLDWAAWANPTLFVDGGMSEPWVYDGRSYTVRRYEGPWGTRFLGVDEQGQVFGSGDFTDGAVAPYGALAPWHALALRDRCLVYPLAADCGTPWPERRMALGLLDAALTVGPERRVLRWAQDGLTDQGTAARTLHGNGTSAIWLLDTAGLVQAWGTFDFNIDGRDFDPSVGRPASTPEYQRPQPFYWPAHVVQMVWSSDRPGPTALLADGSVWLRSGPLVDAGNGRQRYAARRVGGLPAMRQLARGSSRLHDLLAIGRDQRVWLLTLVGASSRASGPASAFVQALTGLPPLRDVVCGDLNCLALASDGQVWVWGANGDGQLGQGQVEPVIRADPRPVPGLADIVDVAVSGNAMLALGRDGRVWSWGRGALGQGTAAAVSTPQAVAGLSDGVEIVAGPALDGNANGAVLVRRRDGTLWAWGQHAVFGSSAHPLSITLDGMDLR